MADVGGELSSCAHAGEREGRTAPVQIVRALYPAGDVEHLLLGDRILRPRCRVVVGQDHGHAGLDREVPGDVQVLLGVAVHEPATVHVHHHRWPGRPGCRAKHEDPHRTVSGVNVFRRGCREALEPGRQAGRCHDLDAGAVHVLQSAMFTA